MIIFYSEVVGTLETILKNVDYICGCSLIGGEPFVNSEICEILKYVIDQPKIGYVIISTNGTIDSDAETKELFKNRKVKIIVSNYHCIDKKNYIKIVDFLRANNCNYKIYSFQKFVDLVHQIN